MRTLLHQRDILIKPGFQKYILKLKMSYATMTQNWKAVLAKSYFQNNEAGLHSLHFSLQNP